MFFNFFLFIFNDNEEYSLNDITHLNAFNYNTKVNTKHNSIKISFGPEHLFRIKRIGTTLHLYDKSNYYIKEVPFKIRIDYETKYAGITLYVYRIIIYSIFMTILQGVLFYKILYKYIC